MKKLLTIMLSVLMVCGLVACSSNKEAEPTETATTEPEATETATADASETEDASDAVANEYKGISVIDGEVEVSPVAASVTTSDGKVIAIVSDFETDITEGTDGLLVFGAVEKDEDKNCVETAKANMSSDYTGVASFTLTPIDADGQGENDSDLISGGLSVAFNVSGVKVGETYLVLHVNNDGSFDTLEDCTVENDGILTVNGITQCSPFIIVKA